MEYRGILQAIIYLQVAEDRSKRSTVTVAYNVTREEAERKVEELRRLNPNLHIGGYHFYWKPDGEYLG